MADREGVYTGGCMCGAVRYQGTGEQYHTAHCHCEDCRRSAGAPFVTWTSFRRDNFRFTKGEHKQVEFAGRLRGFCANCGTTLTFMSGPATDEMDVTVASLDDPAAVTPTDHIWVEDRLPWIQLNDRLPTHPQHRQT